MDFLLGASGFSFLNLICKMAAIKLAGCGKDAARSWFRNMRND